MESTWQERLVTEAAELSIKVDKIEAFIQSDEFESINYMDKELMKSQMAHMSEYLRVVVERVGREVCREKMREIIGE